MLWTVMPFKPAAADEAPAARGGLSLFGPHPREMGMRPIDRQLPPGSAAGYNLATRLLPPVPVLVCGGRTLEDLRVPRSGEGLRSFLRLDDMPGSGA